MLVQKLIRPHPQQHHHQIYIVPCLHPIDRNSRSWLGVYEDAKDKLSSKRDKSEGCNEFDIEANS